MPIESTLANATQIWLALATSGIVLLGFSSLAASLAERHGEPLKRHQIFGIRAITSNSLYLAFLGFLPLLLGAFADQGDEICSALNLEPYAACGGIGDATGKHIWSITSGVILAAMAWQVLVQLWRFATTPYGWDAFRICVFFFLPAVFVGCVQYLNLSANLMPLSLLGATFFASTACGHFYLFLHRLRPTE